MQRERLDFINTWSPQAKCKTESWSGWTEYLVLRIWYNSTEDLLQSSNQQFLGGTSPVWTGHLPLSSISGAKCSAWVLHWPSSKEFDSLFCDSSCIFLMPFLSFFLSLLSYLKNTLSKNLSITAPWGKILLRSWISENILILPSYIIFYYYYNLLLFSGYKIFLIFHQSILDIAPLISCFQSHYWEISSHSELSVWTLVFFSRSFLNLLTVHSPLIFHSPVLFAVKVVLVYFHQFLLSFSNSFQSYNVHSLVLGNLFMNFSILFSM